MIFYYLMLNTISADNDYTCCCTRQASCRMMRQEYIVEPWIWAAKAGTPGRTGDIKI